MVMQNKALICALLVLINYDLRSNRTTVGRDKIYI